MIYELCIPVRQISRKKRLLNKGHFLRGIVNTSLHAEAGVTLEAV